MSMSDDLIRMQRVRHLYEMENRSAQLRAQQQQQQQQQQQVQQGVQVAPILQNMPAQAQIQQAAPQQAPLGRRARKKQEERRQAQERALAAQAAGDQMEAGMLEQRQDVTNSLTMTPEQIRGEKQLLEQRIKAITLQEEADLLADGLTDTRKRELRWEAQQKRAEAAGAFARMLPVGSQEREKAMAVKEAQELKAAKLRKAYKVTLLPPAEREREEATISRHERYDALKAVHDVSHSPNPLSHEDAAWVHPVTGHTLINVGRATMGGTKPMYIFEDKASPVIHNGVVVGYKQYLFKEAINCIGWSKPEGALVTQAAANLQDILCGQYSIPAFAAVSEDGKVLGSFQEKIEWRQNGRVDLFAWQSDPQDTLDAQMKGEILREHTLDWLLCNFDTKGENFIHRTDGHLSSFDKEASFSKLKDPQAAHMSTDYCPHANDTLYNVVFRQYAQGALTLDLSATLPQIQRMEAMDGDAYLALFAPMLEQKYGARSQRNTARAEAEAAILSRKDNLRAEYRSFFTQLVNSRRQALQDQGQPDDCANLLNQNGEFRFQDDP